jgi:carbohydrate-selective porin (OprB family)
VVRRYDAYSATLRAACLVSALLTAGTAAAATSSRRSAFVYPDAMGRPTAGHMPSLPPTFVPPEGVQQVPRARPGVKAPATRRHRLRGRPKRGIAWLPPNQPGLAPYLSAMDELGNTTVAPGALLPDDPISRGVQAAKYRLSTHGFHYELQQAFEYATVTQVPASDRHLGYYTFDFRAKQTVFVAPATAGWLSTEILGGSGLGAASRRTTPAASLGSIADPAAGLSPVNGFAVAELAWQQSFAHGRLVALAGSIDQTNYVDTNPYANSTLTQFQNGALANSQVLPLTAGNLGANLQWEPVDDAYLAFGAGGNATPPGGRPWGHLAAADMSYLLEIGWVPGDALHLGPGGYRLQPFLATVGGTTQGGVGLNMNQQLGHGSPVGMFARLGIGGPVATSVGGASAQIATGLVLQQPLHLAHLLKEASNNFIGAGFVWSQPAAAQRTAAHFDEYAIELAYALQITPTMLLKPDLQVVWNPADNRHVRDAVVAQLPIVAVW